MDSILLCCPFILIGNDTMPLTHQINGYDLFSMRTSEDWLFLEKKYKSPYRGGHVFSNIRKLAERLGCNTVLVENNYIDRDYRDEFSFLYSKTLKNYSSCCTRLHLFQVECTKIDEIQNQGIKNLGYLGYIVIRPIDVGNIGRTVIRPWIIDPNKYYYLCTASFKTHLFGKELSILGTPFIQQDTMVIRCAQASIWTALQFMKKAYDLPAYLPSQITINATKDLAEAGRTVPSEGLTARQMVTALNNLGYSPILYTKEQFELVGEKWKPTKLIYKYIESQIPVIAIVPQHAITIIGHTFAPKPRGLSAILGQKNIISSDNWVSGFIVHDDALGPYRLLPSAQYTTQFKTGREADLLPPKKWPYQNIDDIEAIIVPLPPKVYYPASSVDTAAELIQNRALLSFVYRDTLQGHRTALEFLASLDSKTINPLVLRTYFTLSEKYKENLNKEPSCKEIASTIRWEYRKMRMSRFIWVVEITNVSRLSKEKEKERTIFGEILIDVTATRYGPAWLAIHLPGHLFLRDPNTGKGRHIPVPDDTPYRHASRKIEST